jgi:hypothetical protein
MNNAQTRGRSFNYRKGARYIDTREHFVDQLVKDRIVKQVQRRTNRMVADELKRRPLVRKLFVVLFYWCLFSSGFSIQLG